MAAISLSISNPHILDWFFVCVDWIINHSICGRFFNLIVLHRLADYSLCKRHESP